MLNQHYASVFRVFAIIVFCSAPTAVIAQTSSQPLPSPTPRRKLPKPVAGSRGFKQFQPRDASARLIAGLATRPALEPGGPYSKGEALYKLAKYQEAANKLRIAVSQNPDWADPHYLLGLCLTELGQSRGAIAEFKQAIKFAVKDDLKILSHYNIGNAYADLGEFEKAIENYQRAINLDPTLSKPHNNLGLAYAAVGKLEEAAAEFAEAVRLKSSYAEAHYNLGVAYLQLGKKTEARAKQQELVTLDAKLAAKLEALIRN